MTRASQSSNDKTKIIFCFDLQVATVTQRDLLVLDVIIRMEGAPASQICLIRNAKNVIKDSLGFPIVRVSFNCQHFQNTYSYVLFFNTKIISHFNFYRLQLYHRGILQYWMCHGWKVPLQTKCFW
jgi:hypothetical protein